MADKSVAQVQHASSIIIRDDTGEGNRRRSNEHLKNQLKVVEDRSGPEAQTKTVDNIM